MMRSTVFVAALLAAAPAFAGSIPVIPGPVIVNPPVVPVVPAPALPPVAAAPAVSPVNAAVPLAAQVPGLSPAVSFQILTQVAQGTGPVIVPVSFEVRPLPPNSPQSAQIVALEQRLIQLQGGRLSGLVAKRSGN